MSLSCAISFVVSPVNTRTVVKALFWPKAISVYSLSPMNTKSSKDALCFSNNGYKIVVLGFPKIASGFLPVATSNISIHVPTSGMGPLSVGQTISG